MSKPRMGAPKRVATGLLAGALATFGVALAPQAGATVTVTTERMAGQNRYGTAQAIATNAAFGTPTGAIVATGANFPDALAAATLAGANGPRPIVLTDPTNYSAEAKAALASIKTKVAGLTATNLMAVTLVGGTNAISADVEASIKADGYNVTRTGGTDRYDTAQLIARQANTTQTGGSGLVGGVKTAIFATGENFPDALAAGPIATRNDIPILLVTQSTLPDSTKSAITALGIKNAIVVGGTAVISNDVVTQIGTATGDLAVDRLAGANRNATAAQIADFEAGTLAFPMSSAVLATGLNFPDALAAGPLAGVLGGPIVLTASLPAESKALLDKYSGRISKLYVAGGTSAIDDQTVTDAVAAAQTVSNDLDSTQAPEFQSVAFVQNSSDLLSGVYRFIFDAPVLASPINAGAFKAWSPYGTSDNSAPTPAVGTAAQLDSTNSNAVLVSFSNLNANVSESTVWTVANAAVQDAAGKTNPEGDVVGLAARSFAAGTTRNPDLTSVAPVAATGETQYDFVFDGAAASCGVATAYHIVDSNNTKRDGTACAAVTGAATTVRVNFAPPAAGQTGAKGFVDATATTAGNPVESKFIASGNPTAPDLVSITPVAGSTSQVDFTFDENVDTLGSAGVGSGAFVGNTGGRTGFHLYYRLTGGGGQALTSVSADRSLTDLRTVRATFAPGAVWEALAGGYNDQGAVCRDATAGAAATCAHVGSAGVAGSFAAGSFAGPQLVSASVIKTTDAFGTQTGTTVRYIWDQAVTIAGGGFFSYDVAGNRTALTGCLAGTTTANNTQVNCTLVATTGTEATARANARLATSAAGAVASVVPRTDALGTVFNTSHEERAVPTFS